MTSKSIPINLNLSLFLTMLLIPLTLFLGPYTSKPLLFNKSESPFV